MSGVAGHTTLNSCPCFIGIAFTRIWKKKCNTNSAKDNHLHRIKSSKNNVLMHHTNQGSREIPQGNASSLSELITRTKFCFVSIKTAETVLFPWKQEIKMQQRWTDRTHGNTWKNRNMTKMKFWFSSYTCLSTWNLHITQCWIHKFLSGKTSILLSSDFSKSTNSNPKVMHKWQENKMLLLI